MSLAQGARLGPLEIIAPLGAGGMGEVYRARDTRLGRTVAVKVLPPEVAADAERRARFEREARAASAFSHPNIIVVHDVGCEGDTAFMVMECVEGRTLRAWLGGAPLPAREIAALGAQIAEGLAKAHGGGIAHRDLKPENVMVSEEGLVKILDFGLAKLQEPEGPQPSQASTRSGGEFATRPGAVMGTVSYMSPEQASGRRVDFRTDQFALGLMLYEMASGKQPFRRATSVETLAAIVRDEPEPLQALNPGAPPALCRVVERCLAKDPGDRYASTRDLARDLRDLREDLAGRPPGEVRPPPPPTTRRPAWLWLAASALVVVAAVLAWRSRRPPAPSAPASGQARSIVVLPLQTFGGGAQEDYFTDGMTEAIITDLAKVRDLLVIARNTAFRYKGKSVDVQEVGRELGVRYVLEGSAQRAGSTLRVNVQLIDAASGYQVWADRYDRATSDVFAVQDEISRHVVAALRLTLASAVAGAQPSPPTTSLEAYDAYLRGLFHAQQYQWSDKDQAIPWLEKAVATDPQFAAAHAALAGQYARRSFQLDPGREWESRAFVEVERALSLDPELAEAYAVRGNLVWTLANHFQHERAAQDFKRALSINSNLVQARMGLGSLYLHVGLFDRALEQYDAALRLEPGDLEVLMRIARIHLYRQEYEQALAGLRSRPELARDWQVALALDYLGRGEEARAFLDEGEEAGKGASGDRSDAASVRAILAARAGDVRQVEECVGRAIRSGEGGSHLHHAAYNVASAYALLGRKGEALAWLRRTADEGMPCYPLFVKDPNLDALRSDPGFQTFMAGMKEQWERFAVTL